MSAGLIESARNFVAGLLELGHTRFELFGTELREELARLAGAVIGGLAVLMLGVLALAFAAGALILYVSEENRVAVTLAVALFFFIAAGVLAWLLRILAAAKPRAFDATISELQRDLSAIRK